MKLEIDVEGEHVYIRRGEGVFKAAVKDFVLEPSGIQVPAEYMKLLLEGNGTAWDFVNRVTKSQILKDEMTRLLSMAVEKGFSTAESILRAYIENAPNGRPKLYSARTNLQDDCIKHVYITDGEFCACLEVSDNKPFTLDYPMNVYTVPEISLDIIGSRLHKIEENVEGFFNFAKALSRIPDISVMKTIELVNKYFENAEAAMKAIKDIERRRSHAAEVHAVCDKIAREEVSAVPGGYIVFDIIGGFYFVQDNGRVYQICGRNKDRVKENVFKLYKGKTLEKDLLTDVSDSYRLNSIARKIGKIRPDLAVVI
jgi:hypothetical protein